jgi:group II intron reverse transcriptase/maturase
MNRLVKNLQTGRKLSGSPRKRTDDERVRHFQRKLYRKAKQERSFKFYVLHDKVRLPYFLRESYRRVKRNGGSPGVDGIDFQDIEDQGVDQFLNQIQQELAQGNYRPQAVLRKYIPKANGKLRPLGIPTIKDRVVQMSLKMVIEPTFEADFEEFSFGFRPKRSAKDAVKEIKYHLIGGKTQVFDADLSSYFDTIPHDKLMIALKERIADSNILRLIKQFLKAPIKEGSRITGGKRNKKGSPQGGVISPLLANIYLNLLDRIVANPNSIFGKANVKMIRYADDFVLMAKWMNPAILNKLEQLLNRMELSINWDKSRIVKAREESFDFLGLTFRYDRPRIKGKNPYWNIKPSKKSEKRLRANIKEYLAVRRHLPTSLIIRDLNQMIGGWLNYFRMPGTSYIKQTCFELAEYLNWRTYKHFKRKSQRPCKRYRRATYRQLIREGMIDVRAYAYQSPPANA